MIGYAYRRSPGGRRYSSTDRAAARDAAARNLPATLDPAAIAAMTDPLGIEAVVDASFELESNRLRRPTTVRLLSDEVDVGVDDASMDIDAVVSGRSNPSRAYAMADVNVADSAYVADVGPDVVEEIPVAFGGGVHAHELVMFGAAEELNEAAVGAVNLTPNPRPRTTAGTTTVATNLLPNPSFETNTNGWSGSLFTITRQQSAAKAGAWRLRCEATSSAEGSVNYGSAVTATAGKTYAAAVYVHNSVGSRSVKPRMRWKDAANAIVRDDVGPSWIPAPGYYTDPDWSEAERLEISAVAPTGATKLEIGVMLSTGTTGDIVWIDAAIVVEGYVRAPAYFDGDTADDATFTYSWSGAAHASTSTKIANHLDEWTATRGIEYYDAGRDCAVVIVNDASSTGPASQRLDAGPRIPCVAGKSYHAAAEVWTDAVTGLTGFTVQVVWRDSAGTQIGGSVRVTAKLADPTTPTRIVLDSDQLTAPAGAVTYNLWIGLDAASAGDTLELGDLFYVRNIVTGEGPFVGYFDGDSPGASWSGTPHDSTSVLDVAPVAVRSSWWEEEVTGGAGAWTALHAADDSDPLRLSTEAGPVYVLEDNGAAIYPGGGAYLYVRPTEPAPVRYRIPSSGRRTFTVAFDAIADGGTADIKPSVRFTPAGGGLAMWPAAPTVTVPNTGPGTPTRYTAEVELVGTPGTIIEGIEVRLGIGETTATRLELVNIQTYAGGERGVDVGHLAAAPQTDAVAELTWSDGARRVNRVEISGELRAGHVTSAWVEYLDAVGGSWSYAGAGYGPGRLSIDLDTEVEAHGIRVHVEETSSGDGGKVWLVEVDPMLILDISDDIASMLVTWSREADPGSSPSPVGHYESSTITLELDDTDGRWNPARNASLDIGHRIEAAVGVRYRNRHPNPRADVDLDGWASSASLTRVAGLGAAWPSPTGYRLTRTGAGSSAVRTLPLPVPADGRIRVAGWYAADTDTSGAGASASVVWADPTTGADVVTEWAAPVGELDGVRFATLDLAIPAGVDTFTIELEATATSGTTSATFTALQLEHLDDAWNPITVEELVSAGVFYSEPYDTESASTTVTIEGTDRLGRLSESSVEEEVRVDHPVAQIVADLALMYLDLDADQLVIDQGVGDYVIPYAYPNGGNLGTYLADLAKATAATLHLDALDRLRLAPRTDTTADTVAELRADNALVSYRRPPGVDMTTSIVTVNASPMVTDPEREVWSMPSGGISIPSGGTREVIAPYSDAPAVNGRLHGIVADGDYEVTETAFNSSRAVWRIRNLESRALVVADARVSAQPLVEGALTARVVHEPSVARYGPRELTVDAPMIQTQQQLDTVAGILLDTFRAIDDNGTRRLPDLTLDALGMLHIEAGDRVTVVDPDTGLGLDYAVLGRSLEYAEGALLLNDVKVREAPVELVAVADVSTTDGPAVVGY